MISIIVAVSDDMGIGRDNDLLWNIPEDMKRFKRLTTGNAVIMGRRTWFSLPVRPLPGRKNIVITDIAGETFEGAVVACSIDEAAGMCQTGDEAFVIGGGSIYRQFLPLAGRLYITHVHANKPADVFFPAIDRSVWKITGREDFVASGSTPAYSYVIYERAE